MIKERLLTPEYYYRLLTLLLKETEGVPKQIDLYTDVIKTQDSTINEIFDLLYEEKDDYFSITDNNTSILDQVGKIVGVSRDMFITYVPQSETDMVSEQIYLNNGQFKALIYYTIVKNNYNGSRKATTDFYKILNEKLGIKKIEMTTIYNDSTQSEPGGICHVYYDDTYSKDDNLQKLFLGGYFTLKSMGIDYSHRVVSFKEIAYWDETKWDKNVWG